jgi:hypothetical protein
MSPRERDRWQQRYRVGNNSAFSSNRHIRLNCQERQKKMTSLNQIQFSLPQHRIPQAWYNILPDLPKPLVPTLHPSTLKAIGPDDLAQLFPMSLILQEICTEREIEIPGEVGIVRHHTP